MVNLKLADKEFETFSNWSHSRGTLGRLGSRDNELIFIIPDVITSTLEQEALCLQACSINGINWNRLAELAEEGNGEIGYYSGRMYGYPIRNNGYVNAVYAAPYSFFNGRKGVSMVENCKMAKITVRAMLNLGNVFARAADDGHRVDSWHADKVTLQSVYFYGLVLPVKN